MIKRSALKFKLFDKLRVKIFYIVTLYITISLFLFVYNPFNTMSRADEGMLPTIFGSLIIATIFTVIAAITLFFYKKKIRLERFMIYDFVFMVIVNIILATLVFSIGSVSSVYDFFEAILLTSGIALIPYLLTISICAIRYLVTELLEKKAKLSLLKHEQQNFEKEMICFLDEYGKIGFHLNKDSIIYLEANDNYVNIYFYVNMRVSYKVLRASMKSVEDMLEKHNIIRCHRSYIVNANKIIHTLKEKGKLKLALSESDFLVPVSPSFAPKVLKAMHVSPLNDASTHN